jgi:23S rRNA 5-hydroxycytidine C2501 synthase
LAKSLELLAPAGNAETGMAAIDHGADAVYIGAPRFSARAEAGVTVAEIARLVQHAHLYYARVYVALNTIMTNEELVEAVDIIKEVFRLGVDGLVIQDPGLLELDLPPIPLIASTQMHNNTAEKVGFLESVGFKRVILARELSLEEIAAIRRKTRIELEAFVHGALCVSYSGQCYMSQAATGRSGNRGVCAQPCRSPYNLTDAAGTVIRKEKFLLSLKDLNLMNAIPDLVAAGVTSLKIEGRYKGIEYVKNVTAAYSQAIDKFIKANPGYKRSSSGVSYHTFSPDPVRTFNRGYTRYFISGRTEKVASMDTQKSVGQYVGTVSGIEEDFFRMSRHDLQNGDGLCFFDKRKDLSGFRVDRVDKEEIFPNSMKGLEVGTALYRNYSIAFDRILKKHSARRTIAVEMDFVQDTASVCLTVRDENGHQVKSRIETVFEGARDPSLAQAQIEKQLSSTGNTPYRVTRLTISPQQPGFLPVSILNGIRREALESLTRTRLAKYPRQTIKLTANDAPYPEKKLDFRANVLNEYAERFYERHGAEVTEGAFESLSETTGKTVMTTRYCIRHQLDLCPKYGGSKHAVREPLRISDRHHKYRLEFDCGKCQMHVVLER